MSQDSPKKSATAGRAIVTFGRGWHSLAAVRGLAEHGLEVISADAVKVTPSALSKHAVDSFTYPDPAEDAAGFLDTLEAEIRARKPADGVPYFLLPVQQETYLLAEHRERFEGLIDFALPEHEQIEKVRDKGRLAVLAKEAGLRVPPTWRFESPPTAEELAEVDVPAIVKIPSGAGGLGMEWVEDAAKLPEVYARIRGRQGALPIIQKVVDGQDLCVSAVCDHGRVHSITAYRNLHKASASAPGAVRETVSVPQAEQAVVRLLTELGWHGVAQVDFLWDGESEPWIIEVNPRIFGGLFHSITSGSDIPWMLFCLATGRPLEPVEAPKIGIRTVSPFIGWLGILREMATPEAGNDESAVDRLADAWRGLIDWDAEASAGQRFKRLFSALKEVADPTARWQHIQGVLEENEDNLSEWLLEEDPGVAVGMLFPLAYFLKTGRLDGKVLHGAPAASLPPESAASGTGGAS